MERSWGPLWRLWQCGEQRGDLLPGGSVAVRIPPPGGSAHRAVPRRGFAALFQRACGNLISLPACFPQGLRGGWVPFTRLHVQPWVAPLVGLHLPHQNLKFVHVSLPASGEHWEVGSSAGCHSFHGQPQSLRAPDSPATAVLQGAHA